ncbi:MAG: transglutaminase-like domain-containing protein [bacterium]
MKKLIYSILILSASSISNGEADLYTLLGSRDYIIFINELTIGSMKIERIAINNNLMTKRTIEIELIRGGEKVNQTLEETVELDKNGNLISFTYSEIDSAGKREVKGKVDGDVLTLTGSDYESEMKKMRIRWTSNSIIDDVIQLLPIYYPDVKNFDLDVFYPQFGQFVKTNIEIRKSENNHIIICKDIMTDYEPTEYVIDDSGWLISSFDNSFGMPLKIKLGKKEIENEFDIIKEFRIKVDGSSKAKRFRIYFKEPINKGLLLESDFQDIKYLDDKTAEVCIKKNRIENIDERLFLSEGSPFWAGDEKLKKIVGEIITKKNIAISDKAKMLSNWVNKNLTKKDFSIIHGDSLKALQYGGGDCSEHTYLLVGLLRTAQIPSRGVVGLLRVDDYFYYHMWAEYWYKCWIPLDPTVGTMRVQHIKLFNLPPSGGMDIDSIKLLLGTLKIDRIEVIE